MQHGHMPAGLPPFSKGGARGDLILGEIPLNPPEAVKKFRAEGGQRYFQSFTIAVN